MEIKMYTQNGKEKGTIELNESVFGLEPNENIVHRALIYQLANARLNIAHTKTRGERRWSTRKIYKQKWTGRARMGSARSPIRKKGWVAFGPRNNRNFTISMNKKERRLAINVLLSDKVRNEKLIVLDKISLSTIKTSEMDKVLKSLPAHQKILLALKDKNETVTKSANNLPYVKNLLLSYLNVKDLLKYDTLVLFKDSIEELNSRGQ
jgi:large subunit ribosomal protein L4